MLLYQLKLFRTRKGDFINDVSILKTKFWVQFLLRHDIEHLKLFMHGRTTDRVEEVTVEDSCRLSNVCKEKERMPWEARWFH